MKTLTLLFAAILFAALSFSAFAQTVTITATDAAAAETEAGAVPNPGSIQITRTGSTTGALTVWVIVSGVAVQGTDYTFGSPIGTSVVILAGSFQNGGRRERAVHRRRGGSRHREHRG